MRRRLCCAQRRRNGTRRSYGNASAAQAVDSGRASGNFSDSHISPDSESMEGSLDAITSALQRCAKSKTLSIGRSCHDYICHLGFDSHPYLHSLLVQMYARTHALDDAMAVFTATHHLHQASFIWNHIISGLVHYQQYANALQIYETMRRQCVLPDKFTLTSVLSALTSKEFVLKGKHLHAIILTCGLHQDAVIATATITMYQKCGLLEAALSTFMDVLEPDEVCWTSIISAYAQHCQTEQALHLFGLMLHKGFPLSKFSVTCTLRLCAHCPEFVREGRLLHSCMIECDIKIDTLLGNMLIKFYHAFESTSDARNVYDGMHTRDLASSNLLIRAYAQQRQTNEAYRMFNQIVGEGDMPDKLTYLGLIDACGSALAEEAEGRIIHGDVVEAGFDKDMILEIKLLKMYAKYGRMEDAQRVFEKMREHNAASWATLMSVFASQGKCEEVLSLFDQMQQEGTRPESATCLCMLDACATLSEPRKAKFGHVCVLNYKLESDIIICNFLISMYGRCGSIEDACKVFENMRQHDLVSWTTMIGVHAQQGQGKEALGLFSKMLLEMCPNKVSYLCSINACAGSSMLLEGRLIHFCIIHDGFEVDDEISNALVNMYGKCGSLEDSLHIFMFASARDIISWTALVGAYAYHGQCGEALGHFENMLQDGVIPNKVTFISMLDSVASEKLLILGKQIHSRIIECGLMPDVTIGNAIIKMYGRCHSLAAAQKVFDNMGERNHVSWTAIIAVHAQHCKGEEALELFSQMQCTGTQPNSVTFVCLLDACASVVALAMGECLHGVIVLRNLESNVFIGTALVNMYGKCGQLNSARCIFDRLAKRNLLTWTAIVAVYAHHGEGKEAVKLFKAMEDEGFRADDASLVSILAALSHSGLVDEGSLLFTKMIEDGNVSPTGDQYACMIDLLGRAGRLNEAEVLVNNMPIEPNTATLMSLIGACRQNDDLQRGQCAAQWMLDFDQKESAPYVTVSNMDASIEREDTESIHIGEIALKEDFAQVHMKFISSSSL